MALSTDICYRGLVSANAEAHGCDVVYSYLTPSTRIFCEPFFRHPTEMQHGFGSKKAPSTDVVTTAGSYDDDTWVEIRNAGIVNGAGILLAEASMSPGVYVLASALDFTGGTASVAWEVSGGLNSFSAISGLTTGVSGAGIRLTDVVIVQTTTTMSLRTVSTSTSLTYTGAFQLLRLK